MKLHILLFFFFWRWYWGKNWIHSLHWFSSTLLLFINIFGYSRYINYHSFWFYILRYEYVRSFEQSDALLPNTWIVVRIDGRGFHRYVVIWDLCICHFNQIWFFLFLQLGFFFVRYGSTDSNSGIEFSVSLLKFYTVVGLVSDKRWMGSIILN